MSNLKNHYLTSVVPNLVNEFQYKNKHEIPKIEKICISAGLGLNAQNRVFLQKATEEIRLITGQHPVLTTSRNSIAGFKIREGMPLGLTVTLRREKMYAFLEKFTKYPWIHLDIAGMAYFSSAQGYKTKGATAVGLRLVYNFLKKRIG